MKIDLIKATTGEKSVVANLMQLYIYEFSLMENNDINTNGRYGYKYLKNYWQEVNRHPFLIKVDDKLAGLVLVNEQDPQAPTGYPLGIAEFFVMKKYQGKGVGEEIARKVFDMFRGKWSVRQIPENKGAQEFWEKVISKYTEGNFKKIISDDDRWKGPILLFDNSN